LLVKKTTLAAESSVKKRKESESVPSELPWGSKNVPTKNTEKFAFGWFAEKEGGEDK